MLLIDNNFKDLESNPVHRNIFSGGHSPSNSSGDVQTTSLRPFSRYSSRLNKYPYRQHHKAQYNNKKWIVTTATWDWEKGGHVRRRSSNDDDDISGSSLIETSELMTEFTDVDIVESVI